MPRVRNSVNPSTTRRRARIAPKIPTPAVSPSQVILNRVQTHTLLVFTRNQIFKRLVLMPKENDTQAREWLDQSVLHTQIPDRAFSEGTSM
jgi:hypothetical protein